MMDDLARLPTGISRPWHGILRNNADDTAATLTLADGSAKPWPAPLTSGDCWLLRRPGWPAADPVAGADGRQYLDYCLQPHGTGADPWLLVYAADGVPWLIGVAPAILPAAGSDPERIHYQCWGIPYGRIGQPPADWIAMVPTTPGADNLPSAPYMPDASVLGLGAMQWDPATLMSVSSDGRRWLFKVVAFGLGTPATTDSLLGIYELVFTGGSGTTTPPTFSLVHHTGWTGATGTYVDTSTGHTGVIVHAWYAADNAVETVRIDKTYTAGDGGIRGSLRWALKAGTRLLAEAYLRATADANLNGAAIPGAGAGEYAQLTAIPSTADIRTRGIILISLRTTTPAQVRRLRFIPLLQTKSVISLFTDATNYAFTGVDYCAWLGCGTPGTQDTTTITDTASDVTVDGETMTYTLGKYAGTWHPVTGELLRCQPSRVAFV